MTKAIFMRELEGLLLDISYDERESALRYYEDYFADAGVDKESDIIYELGSPERVAKIIKSELYANGVNNESGGIYTENGYQSTNYKENKYEILSGEPIAKVEKEKTDPRTDDQLNKENNTYNKDRAEYSGYESYDDKKGYHSQSNNDDNRYKEEDRYQGNHQYYDNKGTSNRPNLILIIILAIFAIPVGVPLLFAGFSLLFAFGAVVFSLFIAAIALGVGLSIGGIVTIVLGVITLFTLPMNGVFISGVGLILLGLGMIFSILSIQLIKVVLPGLIRGIVNILSIPFRKRRVAV